MTTWVSVLTLTCFTSTPTVPNPPGSVVVVRKTTSSIEVRWEAAPLMSAASFFYKVTHTPSQGGGYNTSNTSHTLDSLLSGTSYNISIATVGPRGFESEKVHIYMVTTSKVFISVPKHCHLSPLLSGVRFTSLIYLSNNQDPKLKLNMQNNQNICSKGS